MRTYLLIFATLAGCLPGYAYWDKLQTVVQWKRLQFDYPGRLNDINNGIYDPDVPAPIDMDVYYKSPNYRMIFVSIPKFSPGVPITFGLLTDRKQAGDPVIEPFPSMEWHRNTRFCSETRLVSVFRVKIDRCGLLWILDSGNEGDGVICKPQIVVFDLKEWPRVKTPYYRYEFPDVVYNRSSSIFVTPEVENRGADCKTNAFVYVADTTTRSIIATDIVRKYSWRITDKSMHPEAEFSTFNIAGESFFLDDGVLGMALSPEKNNFDDNRALFYSPLSGSKLARINTSSLKAATNQRPQIHQYHCPRRSQSAAMAISRRRVAFFGLMSNITINCWNIDSDNYGRYIHTVYSNPTTMQFPSGMKIIVNPNNQEELWVMTARFQKLMNDGYNFNEINFRISRGNVDELLYGSGCTRPNVLG